MHKGSSKNSIDIGLAVLDIVNRSDEMADRRPNTLTHRDLAEVCECHPRSIQQIEQRTLKKLLARFREYGITDDDLADFFTRSQKPTHHLAQ